MDKIGICVWLSFSAFFLINSCGENKEVEETISASCEVPSADADFDYTHCIDYEKYSSEAATTSCETDL